MNIKDAGGSDLATPFLTRLRLEFLPHDPDRSMGCRSLPAYTLNPEYDLLDVRNGELDKAAAGVTPAAPGKP